MTSVYKWTTRNDRLRMRSVFFRCSRVRWRRALFAGLVFVGVEQQIHRFERSGRTGLGELRRRDAELRLEDIREMTVIGKAQLQRDAGAVMPRLAEQLQRRAQAQLLLITVQ